MSIKLSSKKAKLIVLISLFVVFALSGGYLLWRVNQPETVAPEDTEAACPSPCTYHTAFDMCIETCQSKEALEVEDCGGNWVDVGQGFCCVPCGEDPVDPTLGRDCNCGEDERWCATCSNYDDCIAEYGPCGCYGWGYEYSCKQYGTCGSLDGKVFSHDSPKQWPAGDFCGDDVFGGTPSPQSPTFPEPGETTTWTCDAPGGAAKYRSINCSARTEAKEVEECEIGDWEDYGEGGKASCGIEGCEDNEKYQTRSVTGDCPEGTETERCIEDPICIEECEIGDWEDYGEGGKASCGIEGCEDNEKYQTRTVTGDCPEGTETTRCKEDNQCLSYTLQYTAGTNGLLEGDTNQVVDHGSSGTPVTAIPDEEYFFGGWDDGKSDNPRTDTNVLKSIAVTAIFSETCGNGVCEPELGENAKTCPVDCPAVCGDGFCTHDENAQTCPEDCPAVCGDGFCTHDETPETCPVDCGPAATAPTVTSVPETGIFEDSNLAIIAGIGLLLLGFTWRFFGRGAYVSISFLGSIPKKISVQMKDMGENRRLKRDRKRKQKFEKKVVKD